MEYLTQNAYSKLVGVSAAAITKAVDTGRIIKTKKGIDPEHPHNRHYEANIVRNASNEKRLRRIRNQARKKGEEIPFRLDGKKKQKKQKEELKTEPLVEEKPKQKPKKVIKRKHKRELNLDDIKERVSYGAVTQANVNALKAMEQIEQIRLKTQKERQELVSRDLVKRVFAKIYTIDVNELRTIGDKLAPDIAALCDVDDAETILKVNQRIEKEVYKSLHHIKRLVSDYLKSVGTEFDDESDDNDEIFN